MSQHSPGPWTAEPFQSDERRSIAICAGEHGVIALIPPKDGVQYNDPSIDDAPEVELSLEELAQYAPDVCREPFDFANANLIAAAPEMLEALRGLTMAMESYWKGDYAGRPWATQAYAAIAKAEGR